MLSVVANATVDDGCAVLSDLELYLFFSLLFSAGAETTRNAVAGGLLALAEHPTSCRAVACRSRAAADGRRGDGALDVAVAVEATHRDARRRCWADARSRPAQKVQIWEGSANRDGSVFADADVFDVDAKAQSALGLRAGCALLPWRQPGASGAAGAVRGVARPVLRVEVVEPVEWTRSNRHTGIRHLVVELRA